MRIAIWGAGSVGLGLVTALVRPGEPLLMVGRDPETARAVAARGVRRSGLFGEVTASPDDLVVTCDPEDLVGFAPDWILVCTKAFAGREVAAALEPIARSLSVGTRVALCQNGWGNEAAFLPIWPSDRLYHARVITGFHRRGLVDVEITAHASPIAFGRLGPEPPEPAALALAARVRGGGIPAEAKADMRAVLWEKMLYNCALNPLGALAGRRYGDLIDDPTTRILVDHVISEIFDVLAAADVKLAWPDAVAYRTHFHAELIPPTAQHESSMLQDLRGSRPTEIDALCGAVESLGAEHGVETPVVSALATLVRAAERARPSA